MTPPVSIQQTQRNLHHPHSLFGFKDGSLEVTNSRAWRWLCAPRLNSVLGQGADLVGADVDNEHLAWPHLAVPVLLPSGLLHLHTAGTLLHG